MFRARFLKDAFASSEQLLNELSNKPELVEYCGEAYQCTLTIDDKRMRDSFIVECMVVAKHTGESVPLEDVDFIKLFSNAYSIINS